MAMGLQQRSPNIPLMVCRKTIAGQRGIGGIKPAMKLKIAA